MTTKDRYNLWCNDEYFDQAMQEELRNLPEEEIEDRFYQELTFGTGGLRGLIGAGTNRMNCYTVRKATQGLANYIRIKNGQQKGVAIAYDSRNMSPEFAKEAALCLNGNGVITYLFDSLRPTPELSFAVRHLGCIAGIVITASHNPAEYNGYKVYWEDGAQITAPMDHEIISQVKGVTDYQQVRRMEEADARKAGLFHRIGESIDDAYMSELHRLVLHPKCIQEMGSKLNIVYTPLHGTGSLPVQRILKELGFQNVYVVEEQAVPDGRFPTVVSPNPEDSRAFAMALELAKRVNADLILATDPDADRLGIYAKDNTTGDYQCFTGNMSGILIGEYETHARKELGILPDNGAWVRTIVTSKMADKITQNYGLSIIEVLTGFKYIGEQIKWMEETKEKEYLFGYEESYGCLIGAYARDKDAVSAVMALCEAAAYYGTKGITLWDRMLQLYEEYGYYQEDLATVTLKGIKGARKIGQIMDQLRKEPITQIGQWNVQRLRDYRSGRIYHLETGEESASGLPASNVLYYELSDQAWICIRPSGTEPKIKIYAGVKGNSLKDAQHQVKELIEAAKAAMGI